MRILLAFVAASLLSSCRQDAPAPCDTISGEEYGVYAAILDSLYLGQPDVVRWLPGYVEADSSQVRLYWPDGRLTRCVVKESTLVVEKSCWLFDSLTIAFHKSDEKYAPKWIDWTALAKSFKDLRYCRARIHSERLVTSGTVIVVSDDSLSSVMSSSVGGWQAFYHHFPGTFGRIKFSRVGFNSDRSQAVVYTEHQAAGVVGVSEYWILRRKHDRWVLGWRREQWVS